MVIAQHYAEFRFLNQDFYSRDALSVATLAFDSLISDLRFQEALSGKTSKLKQLFILNYRLIGFFKKLVLSSAIFLDSSAAQLTVLYLACSLQLIFDFAVKPFSWSGLNYLKNAQNVALIGMICVFQLSDRKIRLLESLTDEEIANLSESEIQSLANEQSRVGLVGVCF